MYQEQSRPKDTHNEHHETHSGNSDYSSSKGLSGRQQNERVRNLEARIEELTKVMATIPGLTNPMTNVVGDYNDSQFDRRISCAQIPERFVIPAMKAYDGTTDPDEFITLYKFKMQTTTIPEEVREACMCRSFGACLEGAAMQWFMHLKTGSIFSFIELHKQFCSQFASSRRMQKRSDDLYQIVQKEGESLQQYIRRFNEVKEAIPNYLEETTISAFKKGLIRGSNLFWKLVKYPCATYSEIMTRAEVQIRKEIEEENFGKREKGRAPVRTDTIGGKSNRFVPYPNRVERKAVGAQPPTRAAPKPFNLNANPMVVIQEMMALSGEVRWPTRALANVGQRTPENYCAFHQGYGHQTIECRDFLKEIQRLLEKGRLQHLKSEQRSNTWRRSKMKAVRERREMATGANRVPLPDGPRVEKTIHMISGGPPMVGTSRNAYKRYHREAKGVNSIRPSWLSHEEITFGPADSEGVRHPHDDALVIELLIANCRVRRILVDSGASSNLIFLKAFKGMGIPEKNLSSSSSQLVGFSGEQLIPIGELYLPVYAEGINLSVRFQVVDAESCYNAVMGRSWMHEVQAVPSFFHQVIKFSTPWGIRSIKGEQHTARDCYAVTLDKHSFCAFC